MITIIPDIDTIGGECVRLTQGDYASRKTSYYRDPLEAALRYRGRRASAACTWSISTAPKPPNPVNLAVLERVATRTGLEVQYGGGIKSREALRSGLFDAGAEAAPSAAASPSREPDTLRRMAHGLRARNGLILGADIARRRWWLDPGLAGKFGAHGRRRTDRALPFRRGLRRSSAPTFRAGRHAVRPLGGLLRRSCKAAFPADGDHRQRRYLGAWSDIGELDRQGLRSVIVGKALYEGARYTLTTATPQTRCLAKRIIPCLDIRDGQTVKGINFVGLQTRSATPWNSGAEIRRRGGRRTGLPRHQRLGGGPSGPSPSWFRASPRASTSRSPSAERHLVRSMMPGGSSTPGPTRSRINSAAVARSRR